MVDAPEPNGAAASSSTAGRHYRSRRRPLRRWPRRLLIGVNVLTVLVIAASAVGAVYVVGVFGDIHRASVPNLAKMAGSNSNHVGTGRTAKPFTMLIVGGDTRNLSKATGLDIGSASQNGEDLGDSIILARVVPAAHRVALLSIPRDLVVNVPGLGDTKINAAFAGGNAGRLVKTIESDIHIPINHFAAVNFDTLEQVADIVGGVEQFFPTPAFDEESGLFVASAGCVNLSGAQALAFVRSRNYYYVPDLKTIQQSQTTAAPGVSPPLVADGEADLQLAPESDLGRIQRQQAFIRNTIHKAQRTGALSSPTKLLKIVDSLAKNLTLDSSFSDTDIINLATDFRHVDAAAIPSWTYPTVNASYGLSQVPTADAAMVKQFESFGLASTHKAAATTTTTGRTGSSGSTTTSSTVPPSSISVAVENGSGVASQAGTAASDLESAGFTVSTTTDATSFGHTANVVEYGPSGRAAARTLEADLAGGATLEADSSLTGTDLILITGTDFNGVSASGSSSTSSTSSTTAPATTTTTAPADGNAYSSASKIVASSSSYYHHVYIPPGRVPGQKVSTCGN